MKPVSVTELARAKVNLTLHVGAIISDQSNPFKGYHPLDSLVIFSDIADRVTLKPAQNMSLDITGPFSKNLTATSDNLIMKAVAVVQQHTKIPNFKIELEKNIPVSAGLGGGSANAAATLRALGSFCELEESVWHKIAMSLGADVPVCRLSQTAHMAGIGEKVIPMPSSEQFWAVLVNPLKAVSTAEIFKSFDDMQPDQIPQVQMQAGSLLSRSLAGKNDLEITACQQLPVITDILRGLASQTGCELARMSGSGASCFGIYSTRSDSLKAAQNLTSLHPNWWIEATRFG